MQINEIKEFIDDTNKEIISDEVKKEMLEKRLKNSRIQSPMQMIRSNSTHKQFFF